MTAHKINSVERHLPFPRDPKLCRRRKKLNQMKIGGERKNIIGPKRGKRDGLIPLKMVVELFSLLIGISVDQSIILVNIFFK